jgi:hypothetical protein
VSGGRMRVEEIPDPDHLKKDKIKRVWDWKEIADPTGMVLFRLEGLGKKDGVKMIQVFNAINRELRFYEDTLGRVQVDEEETTVEVPYHVARSFHEKYRKGKLLGRKVTADVVPRHDA